jgi:hypothetical protein
MPKQNQFHAKVGKDPRGQASGSRPGPRDPEDCARYRQLAVAVYNLPPR